MDNIIMKNNITDTISMGIIIMDSIIMDITIVETISMDNTIIMMIRRQNCVERKRSGLGIGANTPPVDEGAVIIIIIIIIENIIEKYHHHGKHQTRNHNKIVNKLSLLAPRKSLLAPQMIFHHHCHYQILSAAAERIDKVKQWSKNTC